MSFRHARIEILDNQPEGNRQQVIKKFEKKSGKEKMDIDRNNHSQK